MVGVDIFGGLHNSKPVTDIVGRRIYPNDASAKETPLPCIVYWLQNLALDSTYDAEGTIELASVDLVVMCIAKEYPEVQALYDAVMKTLVDYKGGRIEGIKHSSSTEDSIFNPNTDELQHYSVEITFSTWFNWKSS